ncbi:beta-galactosidase [Bacteroides mediterraneensis]|uniref:beta-galactosidase n=1 Tax=Bacteroides mediterraneensis TaxID=1841856 RepID=UPI0009352C3B|nr:beta-galactosidase [Bacteroides mediterraneensis]
MKRLIGTMICLMAGAMAMAQQVYELDMPVKEKTIYSGHLKLGGSNPSGERIEVNSYYMSIGGKPVIPVMGEFHYSRYPECQWEEEILKMKVGGVTVIPTYVFWSIHEEQEGVFNWTGNRNLRKFLQLCQKHGMWTVVRIGPFCHGEIRNGGLPDWLFAKPLEIRSNDVNYLKYVKRFYEEIGRQLDGLYYKDGGTIIGTQIENEHQHSAAPWGITYPGEPKDMTSATYDADIIRIGVSVQDKKITTAELGDLHMKTLKKMAEEAGIQTPLYTATGWGNAAVIGEEAIPVTAAYTYPFWSKPKMSPFCLFKDIQKSPDYAPVRYDTEKFPSFCAEMGVGIQMIYTRRPIVTAKAAEALMVRTLGSGANGIGYYMYHGGSTPKMGPTAFFSDEPMGMPKISYDFQAPLGEFGLEHGSYRALRLLHLFLNDFSEQLAPMETVLPKGYAQLTPANRETLRYAARVKGKSGFVFMVNFQDHDTARIDQKDLCLRLKFAEETLRIPAQGTFTLPKDESLILPFNFRMEDALLKYATAQLLLKLDDKGMEHYFFFVPEGIHPEFMFDKATVAGKYRYAPEAGLKSTFTVKTAGGKRFKVTTLTREQALNACKVDGKLLLTSSMVLPGEKGVRLLNMGNPVFRYVMYPSARGFKEQTAEVPAVQPEYTSRKVGSRRLAVRFSGKDYPQVNDYFLQLNYVGDVAMAFLKGKLVLDHFYYGAPWQISLKRFQQELVNEELSFYIRPLRKNAPFLSDLPKEAVPDFSKGAVVRVDSVQIVPQYVTTLHYPLRK